MLDAPIQGLSLLLLIYWFDLTAEHPVRLYSRRLHSEITALGMASDMFATGTTLAYLLNCIAALRGHV